MSVLRLGLTGRTIIRVSRLIDAAGLRRAMVDQGANLGIIASAFVYETVIRHGQAWSTRRTTNTSRPTSKNRASRHGCGSSTERFGTRLSGLSLRTPQTAGTNAR